MLRRRTTSTNDYLYINGVLVGWQTNQPGAISPSGNDLHLGHDPSNPSRYFSGLIDEACIYTNALSAAQIQTIYLAGNAGKCGSPPIIVSEPQNQTVVSNSSVSFTVRAVGSQPLVYQWQLNGTNISSLSNPTATNSTLILTNAQGNQSGNIIVLVSSSYGPTNSATATLAVIAPPCAPPPASLVAWWPGEGDATDIANGNNGTFVGAPAFSPGMAGQAFDFDGASQYVDVLDNPSLDPSSISVEAWVYLRAYAPLASPIVKKADGNDGYALECGSDGNVRFYVVTTFGGNWVSSPGAPLPLNTWTHFAGVYADGRPCFNLFEWQIGGIS